MKTIWFGSLGVVLLLQLSLSEANALVKFGPSVKQEIKGLKLSESVQISDGGVGLSRITQGLRQKKVVFAWFSVYVTQIFSSTAKPNFTSVEQLKSSLGLGYPLVVAMTFVRKVEISKISDGFTEVFKENKIDADQVPYRDFIAAVKASGDVSDRQTYFFVFDQAAGKESLSVQTNGKEIFTLKDQSPGTIGSFLNMWLGKPTDSGLEQLQKSLLKPNL